MAETSILEPVNAVERRVIRFDGERVGLHREALPEPGPGCVRVRTEWTQVSIGTELAWLQENAVHKRPAWLGYSHVGIIDAVGAGVDGWRVGQRVLSSGSHASLVVAPVSDLVAVPEGLAPERAVFGMLGSIAYHIVQRAAPRLLEPTAVVGQGAVGSLVLQLLRGTGVEPLIAVDADPERLRLPRELGVETVDASSGDAAARVRELTGGAGVALCVEAATSAAAFRSAFAMLALRGRLVATSTLFRPIEVRVLEDVIERELTIIGAHQPKCPLVPNPYHPWTQSGNRAAAMRAIRDGRIRVDELVTHRVTAAEAPALYARLLAGDRSIAGALIDWR